MAYTSTPTACPTCGALTFDGRINVKVWRGDNGLERYYPAGDHGPVCEANVARNAANAVLEAKAKADQARNETIHRWTRRAKAVLEAHPEDEAMRAKAQATVVRLMGM